jgi:shikimate dehydrogenase
MIETPVLLDDAIAAIPRFAVFGAPIAHSKSPLIHRRFGEQLGIALEYRAIECPAGAIEAALARFAADGGQGANITLPHKLDALAVCSTVTPRARRAGVVNTLRREGGSWHGDNTDGSGLVADLAERHRLDLRGRRVLMLGAGGAAQGVLPAVLDAGVDSIVICNRTPDRADRLSDRLGEPARVRTVYWSDLGDAGAFDLVLNATSAGHGDATMPLPFGIAGRRTTAYDLSYGTAALGFLAWARAAHCEHALDGLGMLVEQAADAFALWHGKRPDTEPVYRELRSAA